jgi:hypothetical protein
LRIGSLTPFSLHIPFGKKRGAKLVDPPQALFDLIPQGDGVVLFKQIQKPLPLSRFEVDPGQGSAARAAGSLLVVTLDLAVGLTLRGDPEGKYLPGKPFAARLSGQEPDVLEHRDILRRVTARGPARCPTGSGPTLSIEDLDRILALKPGVLAKVVRKRAAGPFSGAPGVALPRHPDVIFEAFLHQSWRHSPRCPYL